MSDNYEAVGRAVERLFAEPPGSISVYVDSVGRPLAIRGIHDATGRTTGEALIALAEKFVPSWEARMRKRCAELGLGAYWSKSTSAHVLVTVRERMSQNLLVAIEAADHETAARAALAALDVLHPRVEPSEVPEP